MSTLNNWIQNDITFCISPCEHKECFRHISNLTSDHPKVYSAADLINTEYCPFSPENIEKANRFHKEENE